LQLFCGICSFFIWAGNLIAIYYLPLYYQTKGKSASQSGTNIIPYMMSLVLGAIFSGFIVSRTGRYWYNFIVGPIIGAVGAGLLFTIKEDTKNANIIGYQILVGFGIGIAFQMPREFYPVKVYQR
jgi:MFS family permease